jgi:hypothetical protein
MTLYPSTKYTYQLTGNYNFVIIRIYNFDNLYLVEKSASTFLMHLNPNLHKKNITKKYLEILSSQMIHHKLLRDQKTIFS